MTMHERKPLMKDDELPWTHDPAEFPTCRAISTGMLFRRRVLVYHGEAAKLEFVSVPMPALADWQAWAETYNRMNDWNCQWEGGPYRAFDLDDLTPPLAFLRKMEASPSKGPESDIILLPSYPNDIYEKWAPLYHLLPRSMLKRHGLPVIARGAWPVVGGAWTVGKVTASNSDALARAFAEHLWAHGLGPAGSPLGAFSRRESLVLLSHDLGYWRPHMEKLVRSTCRSLGRVRREDGDSDPESIPETEKVSYELPTFGCELWTGEAEASEVTRELIDTADEHGRLRAVMDAVRSHRVQDDFSQRWSFAREDFERKLYRKRCKTRVSFVEFNDSLPFHDGNADLDGNLLYRDLLSVVDPKDRHVIVCLHSGLTNLSDIASELGYANHSPVSKALDRIRKRAQRLLED